MAKIDDVRAIFRNLKAVVSRPKTGTYHIELDGILWKLLDRDVNEYLKQRQFIERPRETAIFVPNYFEHVAEVLGPRYALLAPRSDGGRGKITLKDKSGRRTIALSPMSPLFVLSLIDQDEIAPSILRRIKYARRVLGVRFDQSKGTPPKEFHEAFSRDLTVKISTSEDDPRASDWKKLESLVEAAVFHIAYGNGVGISLAASWERTYYRSLRRQRDNVQFPLRTYRSELLGYYHLALGSESPVLAYLALYKILEFFFTSSSERILHEKVKDALVQPDFSHTKPTKLRALAKLIRTYDAKNKENRMLRAVLEQYFDTTELRESISAMEDENGAYFTLETEVFAEKLKIDLSDNQIFISTAERIYHIRNALVHHKEEEVSRFTPFSGQEEVLYKELPLLLYLAGQIIIRTGKSISDNT